MNLGVFVNNLGPSQLAYSVITELNKLVKERTDIAPVVFTTEPNPPCAKIETGIFNQSEIWGFNGKVVATSLQGAHQLLQTPGQLERYFYIWDLEWLRMTQGFVYDELLKIYSDPRLKLICRSQDHANIMKNNFNVEITGIVENFNIKELLEIL